jgi:hypothetical protein
MPKQMIGRASEQVLLRDLLVRLAPVTACCS